MSDKTESKELQVIERKGELTDIFSSNRGFDQAQRFATTLAKSSLVPKEYQGSVPNCMIAIEIACRTRMSPFMVMQNTDIIHSKPSWSSKFIIAMINACGRYEKLRFKVDGKGDKMSCYAETIEKDTGEVLKGTTVTMEMAKAEGWLTKTGSKWKTMPELMIKYRAATFFAREHCPELLMGLFSNDEIIDIEPVPVEDRVKETVKEKANKEEINFDDAIDAEVKEVEKGMPEPEEVKDGKVPDKDFDEVVDGENEGPDF